MSYQPRTVSTRRSIAAAGLAIALMPLSCGIALAAGDSPAITGNVDGLNDAAVKQVSTCSEGIDLRIVKQAHNPYSDPPQTGPFPPIQGSTFTVKKIKGIDLTKADGWKKASELTVSDVQKMEVEKTYTAVTDATGTAMFSHLPIGLYLVEETPAHLEGYTYEKTPAFVVALPTRNSEGTAWSCDVRLNPKAEVTPEPSTPLVPPTSPEEPQPPTSTELVPPTPENPENPDTPLTPPPGGDGGLTPPPGGEGGLTPPPGGEGGLIGGISGSLASTGANVRWAIGIGAGLVIAGAAVLILRRRRKDEAGD